MYFYILEYVEYPRLSLHKNNNKLNTTYKFDYQIII